MTETLWSALRRVEQPLYVVGGAVRDWALGQSSKDLDLAVEGDVSVVGRAVAAETGGHFFVLHQSSQTARVALPDGSWVDFVGLMHGLEQDLRRRDFTVNAMATPLEDFIAVYPARGAAGAPPTGLQDPTGGWHDLRHGILRMPRPEAFAEDPLRALRGLRFIYTLAPPPGIPTFAPDAATLDAIRVFAPGIGLAAPERVRDEWLSLMNGPRAAEAVPRAASLGFLDLLLPEWREMEGVTQNAYHHLDVWEHTLEVLRQFDALIAGAGAMTVPEDLRPLVDQYLAETPTPTHTRRNKPTFTPTDPR